MGRHHVRAGTNGQANAGDVAFCHVAARLLAVAQIRPYFPQGSGYKTLAARAREDTVVLSRGSVRGCHIRRAISSRRYAHIHRGSYYAATVECACLVCEILIARVLAE